MNTLKKTEILRNKKNISLLFENGFSAKNYPFVIVYHPLKQKIGHSFQFAVSVPKKHFKKSVDRNRIKRQIKEIARVNKSAISKSQHFLKEAESYAFMIIYIAKKKENFAYMERRLLWLFSNLENQSTLNNKTG